MSMRRYLLGLISTALVLTMIVAVDPASASRYRVPSAQFPTIQGAVDDASVKDGDMLVIKPGHWAGATLTKRLVIKGLAGATIIGDANSPTVSGHTVGFLFPGNKSTLAASGSIIMNLTFDESVDFPIYSYAADDVLVVGNTMIRPIQGITSWNGNGWNIQVNNIYGLRGSHGGGIGILIGSRPLMVRVSSGNMVLGNKIEGVLRVSPGDSGYIGAGISLLALGPSNRRLAVAGNVIRGNDVPGGYPAKLRSDSADVRIYSIMLNEMNFGTTPQCKVRRNTVVQNNLVGIGVRPLGQNPNGLTGAGSACLNRVANNILSAASPALSDAAEGEVFDLRPF